MKDISRYGFYAGVIVWIICHSLWLVAEKGVYYFGISFVILTTIFAIKHHTKSINQSFIDFSLFVATANLSDELIGDPTVFSWNEYVWALIAAIYFSVQYFKPSFKTWLIK